jgi:hypothetical protein
MAGTGSHTEPLTNLCRKQVGTKMSDLFWPAVAVGFLVSVDAEVQERAAFHGGPSWPVELSEAFPWNEPVEQTFAVDSMLRWRRSGPAKGKRQRPVRAGRRKYQCA